MSLRELAGLPASETGKRTVYVGGLPSQATVDILRAAFIPFGELVDVVGRQLGSSSVSEGGRRDVGR